MRGQFSKGRNDLDKAIAFAIQQAHERLRITLYREFHDHGLEITPEQCDGRTLRAPLMAHARRIVRRIERGIAEADLRVTRRTLKKIFANLA